MARNVTLMTEWTKLYSVINLATPGYRTENIINSLVNGKLLINFTYAKPLVVINAGISNILVKDSVDSVVKGLDAVVTLIIEVHTKVEDRCYWCAASRERRIS